MRLRRRQSFLVSCAATPSRRKGADEAEAVARVPRSMKIGGDSGEADGEEIYREMCLLPLWTRRPGTALKLMHNTTRLRDER
jgi:hypothetical protein